MKANQCVLGRNIASKTKYSFSLGEKASEKGGVVQTAALDYTTALRGYPFVGGRCNASSSTKHLPW